MGGTPGFVGRHAELGLLAGCLREAMGGHGRLVTVVGEPGIGKTRTIEELVARSSLSDAQVLWGRCPEHEGAPAYWPWSQIARAWLERHDVDTIHAVLGADAARIAQIAPAVREHFPDVELPVDADPNQARFQLFDAVTRFLVHAARREPLAVVLDDLHWADPASLQLLGFVARELRGVPLLLLGTYRELEMARVPGRLEALARVSQRLPLRGLDASQVRDFIQATAGAEPPSALVSAIHRTAEGNPFFTAELVRVLRAEGGFVAGGRPIALPEEVRATVRRRLEPLAIDDRRLLSIAAVVGREFDLVLLEQVCELGRDKILERLTLASEARLVEEVADVLGRFRFAHALVRETLYEDLTPTTRAQLHRQVGQALERLHADAVDPPLTELAHHFYHAAPLGGASTAIRWAIAASERAERLVGWEEAIAQLERALELLSFEPADESRHIELLIALGRCAMQASDTIKGRAAFADAVRRSRATGNVGGLIRGALGMQQSAGFAGMADPVLVDVLESALVVCADADNPFRPYLLMALTAALYFSADRHRCTALSDEALALARRGGDTSALAAALLIRHMTLLGLGDPRERMALADEALALPTDPLLLQTIVRGHVSRVLDLLELADVSAAERHTEQFAMLAEAWHLPAARWHAGVLRATLAHMAGRLDDALRLAVEALGMRRDAQDVTIAQMFVVQCAMHARETGRDGAHIEAQIAAFAQDFPAVPAWRCFLNLLRVETGREAEARADVDALAAVGFASIPEDLNFLPTLVTLAETVACLGDADRAAVLYPKLLPFADRCVVVSLWASACLGSVQRYLGLLAATMGRTDEAVAHLETALAVHERMGARPLTAHTQADLARVLDTVDPARAAVLRAAARATADRCGMTRLRERLGGGAGGPSDVAAIEASLKREGDYWTLRFGGRDVRLKDTKGLHYLATLLRHAGRELHVMEIAGGTEAAPDATPVDDRGDAGELLDPAARAAYMRRIDALGDELEDARRFDDAERATRAEREIEFLERELSRGVGLGGRVRRAASASERARLNITRAIGRVVEKIAASDATLGQHLEATVHTGTFCVYAPDSRVPVRWDV